MDSEFIFSEGPIVIPEPARSSREVGAVVEFSGIVREQEGGERIAGLSYETYEPMARREFDRICSRLLEVHPVHSLLLIHRLGDVPVGDASLYVRVEARNRGPALAFCGGLIDRMKEDVPIWKRPLVRQGRERVT